MTCRWRNNPPPYKATPYYYVRLFNFLKNSPYIPPYCVLSSTPFCHRCNIQTHVLRPANSSHRTSSEYPHIDFHALTHLHGAFLQPTISSVYQNTKSIPTFLTKPSGRYQNWLLKFLSLLCISHVAFERRKTLSRNPWLFSTRNEGSLTELANCAGRVIVWLWQLSYIRNKDTVLRRPIVHCGQHNGSPLQARSTAPGVGFEKDKVSRYKKYIYRFSATYDVIFSLRNCATPQRGIFNGP